MRKRRPLTPLEQLHSDWINMLQPEGLVVSIPVLVETDAYVRRPPEVQEAIRALTPEDRLPDRAAFERLLTEVLGWPASRMAGPDDLERQAVALPELGVVFRPDACLLTRQGQALIYLAWTDGALDEQAGDPRWPVTRHGRFERLLLESQGTDIAEQPASTGTPIGLHACPTALRLTFAPRGEAPGSMTFPFEALRAWDGRLLVDALLMLLGKDRLFTVPADKRLLALLRASRQRQEQVTVALAGQVEEALATLLAGFDLADARSDGALLHDLADDEGTAKLRAGLVAILLRLVFLLYCEDQTILPMKEPVYLDNYSLARLADRLQEDAVRYPETMRHRYGAWAQLCALFRLVWAGARHGDLDLPPRQGELFDPDSFPFLEGRSSEHAEAADPPPVDDAVVAEVLDGLIYLEGQRISYRNLDVEQIGSVYEALMGIALHRAHSTALPLKGGGWVEVGDLLDTETPAALAGRLAVALGAKLAEVAGKVPGLAGFEPSGDPREDEPALRALLAPVLDPERESRRTGQHYLAAGAERRRTGSHYTPSALTRPIVERTLAPVLDRSGLPSSESILTLKVCDPAMGSGAFLAEACRYLARRLLDAWIREGGVPAETRGRDPLLYARRLVAERCLYGVDKNPFAVQLARLSLWLVTLASDLPFTFVDHALREGDAVIGLTAEQIGSFAFEGTGGAPLLAFPIRKAMKNAQRARALILSGDFPDWKQKSRLLDDAQGDVAHERTMGDLLLACAWAGGKKTEQRDRLVRVGSRIRLWYQDPDSRKLDLEIQRLLDTLPFRPFHWDLEFPEVFARDNPGFDAVVGNPPFLGGKRIRTELGDHYRVLVDTVYPSILGGSDYCVLFFLQAAAIARSGACIGLVATDNISDGASRESGLLPIVQAGNKIYHATTGLPWPGSGTAVIVSVVHIAKGFSPKESTLNESSVDSINSFLQEGTEDAPPVGLLANSGLSFGGCVVDGDGFELTPQQAEELLRVDVRNSEIVKPYLGGDEVNSNPDLGNDRFIIDFRDLSLEQARQWPVLIQIVEDLVRPRRQQHSEERARRLWWQFRRARMELRRAVAPLQRCLVCSMATKYLLFAFQPADRVFSHKLNIIATESWFWFGCLQSRVHEAWAFQFSSGRGSGLNYTPSTCFETFPFPRPTPAQQAVVAAAGQALYEHRAALMLRYNEGMTKIWNRLLNLDEQDAGVLRLRELREAMDRAVLAAYGWSNVEPDDTAGIVRRLRALNAERAAEEARGA